MVPGRGVGCLEQQNVLQSINRTNPHRGLREAELNDTLKRSMGKEGGGKRVVQNLGKC